MAFWSTWRSRSSSCGFPVVPPPVGHQNGAVDGRVGVCPIGNTRHESRLRRWVVALAGVPVLDERDLLEVLDVERWREIAPVLFKQGLIHAITVSCCTEAARCHAAARIRRILPKRRCGRRPLSFFEGTYRPQPDGIFRQVSVARIWSMRQPKFRPRALRSNPNRCTEQRLDAVCETSQRNPRKPSLYKL
jgi:hypothetical protein